MPIDVSTLNTAFLTVWGETIRYRTDPAADFVTLSAVVDRERYRSIEEAAGTLAGSATVYAAVSDVDPADIRSGVSQFFLSLRIGAPAEWRTVRGPSYQDAGFVYVEVG